MTLPPIGLPLACSAPRAQYARKHAVLRAGGAYLDAIATQVGSAVFYRYELWHRGSAMKPGGLRIMHSFAFRRADAPWLGGVAAGYGLEVRHGRRSLIFIPPAPSPPPFPVCFVWRTTNETNRAA